MNLDDSKINLLSRAIALAADAHLSHLDKAGKPYILHPLRVMFSLGKVSEEEQIVAVLHDVVEDSSWTLEKLEAEGFSGAVVCAIDCLTRRNAESYGNYIRRISKNPIASKIKLEDLKDNADLGRFDYPTQADILRSSEKYRKVNKKLCELLRDFITRES